MKVVLYTPNLDVMYEHGVVLINYCYQGLLHLAALIHI
jgi:hypothetical protein